MLLVSIFRTDLPSLTGSGLSGWEPAGLLSLWTELELPRQRVPLLLGGRDTPAYISLGVLWAQGLILQGQYMPWTREVLLHGRGWSSRDLPVGMATCHQWNDHGPRLLARVALSETSYWKEQWMLTIHRKESEPKGFRQLISTFSSCSPPS